MTATVLTTARIGLMHDVYRTNPYSAARIDALAPLKRGALAARTLAECRKALAAARAEMDAGNHVEARRHLVSWAINRREWAQLTRQTTH